MKIAFLLLILCTTATAQSSTGLRQKYGSPVKESYLVRDSILATASYNKEGRQVCEILIEPLPPSTPIKSDDQKIKSGILDELINELVPMQERGKHLMSGFLNLTCLPRDDCAGTGEDYENVYIYRNGGIDSHRYATIQWKKVGCGK